MRIAGASPQQIEATLRRAAVPVVGRINRDRFLLDIRTIFDRELPALCESIRWTAGELSKEES